MFWYFLFTSFYFFVCCVHVNFYAISSLCYLVCYDLTYVVASSWLVLLHRWGCWWRSGGWTLLSFYLSGLSYWRFFIISPLTWCISLYLECICYFVVLFFFHFQRAPGATFIYTVLHRATSRLHIYFCDLSYFRVGVSWVSQGVRCICKVLFSHLALEHTVFKFEHLK